MNRQAIIEKIKSSIETSTNRTKVESPMPQPEPEPSQAEPVEAEPVQGEQPQTEPEEALHEALHEPLQEQPQPSQPSLDDMKVIKRELAKAIKKNKFPCVVGKSVFQSSDELLTFNSEFIDMFNSEKKAAKKNKLKAAKKDFIERFDGRAEELNLKKPRKDFDEENYNIDSEGFVRRLSKPIGVVSGDSVIEIPKTNKEERERFLQKHGNELKQSQYPKEVINRLADTDDDAFKHSHGFSSDKTFSSKIINEFIGLHTKPTKITKNTETSDRINPYGLNPSLLAVGR